MSNRRCLIATTDDALINAVGKRTAGTDIHIAPAVPTELLLRDPASLTELHGCSAVVMIGEIMRHSPREWVREVRRHQPRIVVLFVIEHRNDLLEQQLINGGADDVMWLPLNVDTLICRLSTRLHLRAGLAGRPMTFNLEEMRIDLGELRCSRTGWGSCRISKGLAAVLHFLLSHPNQTVTRSHICATLWAGHAIDPAGKNLDMHIAKLRRLLGRMGLDAFKIVETVRGVGYRLNVPESHEAVTVKRRPAVELVGDR